MQAVFEDQFRFVSLDGKVTTTITLKAEYSDEPAGDVTYHKWASENNIKGQALGARLLSWLPGHAHQAVAEGGELCHHYEALHRLRKLEAVLRPFEAAAGLVEDRPDDSSLEEVAGLVFLAVTHLRKARATLRGG